jgi:hypothetical protein
VSNIFTGSPAPLDVYEDVLKIGKYMPPLVRCPIYLMIRTFCQNGLSPYFDVDSFLDAGLGVVDDLLKCTGVEAFVEKLRNELGKADQSQKVSFLSGKLCNYQLMFDVFRMNEGFSYYFDDALKSHFFNAFCTMKWKEKIFSMTPEAAQALRIIKATKRVIEDQKEYEEKLIATDEKIYNNMKDLYTLYYKMMDGYDYSKLSPLMKQHYDFVLSEPTEKPSREIMSKLLFQDDRSQ